jgi:hypothetical protein
MHVAIKRQNHESDRKNMPKACNISQPTGVLRRSIKETEEFEKLRANGTN